MPLTACASHSVRQSNLRTPLIQLMCSHPDPYKSITIIYHRRGREGWHAKKLKTRKQVGKRRNITLIKLYAEVQPMKYQSSTSEEPAHGSALRLRRVKGTSISWPKGRGAMKGQLYSTVHCCCEAKTAEVYFGMTGYVLVYLEKCCRALISYKGHLLVSVLQSITLLY